MTKSKQIISTDQFKAIHEVIYSTMVALNINPLAVEALSMFNFIGSYLLFEHHDLEAVPQIGTACLKLSNKWTPSCINYDKNKNIYHSWVWVDVFYVDFTSPLYDKFLIKNANYTIPSKMFQKYDGAVSNKKNSVKNKGDFYYFDMFDMWMLSVKHLFTCPDYLNLFKICRLWYNSDPAKIPNSFSVQVCCKQQLQINKINVNINGAW